MGDLLATALEHCDDMAWAKPQYSRSEIDKAGHYLATADWSVFANWSEIDECLNILNNWRSSHSFPLNTFQTTLRKKARAVFPSATVAQRIKRVDSTLLKLRRFPKMKLSQMQDIGGCRAVVKNSAQVIRLRNAYRRSHLRHELVRQKDYIAQPKASGYRGIHLIYRYTSDKSQIYNDLQIEIQLRSRIQHAWATAVETAGTFLQRSLKSSEGPEEWLRFFAVTSSAFALVEAKPTVPDTPSDLAELKRVITECATKLQVAFRLRAFHSALNVYSGEQYKDAHTFLLELNPDKNALTVSAYSLKEARRATSDYLEVEKRLAAEKVAGAQVVLVGADSLDALRRAYPNYYLDTTLFLEYLNDLTRPEAL